MLCNLSSDIYHVDSHSAVAGYSRINHPQTFLSSTLNHLVMLVRWALQFQTVSISGNLEISVNGASVQWPDPLRVKKGRGGRD